MRVQASRKVCLHTACKTPPQRAFAARPPSSTGNGQSSFLQRFRLLRKYSSKTLPKKPDTVAETTVPEPTSLSQRLKKLSREYGWSALGVYLALSVLDFPFCFLAIKWLGTDRVGQWEHVVVQGVKDLLQKPFAKAPAVGEESDKEWDWGVKEAQKEIRKPDASEFPA